MNLLLHAVSLDTLDSGFDTGRFVDYVEKLHRNRDKGFEEQFKVNQVHLYNIILI